ncbi:hypothetical protein TTHERM_000151729 (macronuclear) [Tetrahymena thermophila SB210]|uniref:Uncharacterized protein n=1 Tax=Tetrahymena thermophila (strain SB210) TaxID=312017 RepID=W7X9I2_TETTS|nr:hypothetical protein TTHERM_000151729 [Tetrahymena thermophila SB210]EWS73053.1 hypothetical protein TTHERM_000151729 [Tetrahymena thermophila SB210]|eukprot:XP_012654450.1 hypothetical protein TTHERM_000151729 [Tetrahymena thermophila SB210]
MDDLDNSTTSYSESIVNNKLLNQVNQQQKDIAQLQQNYSSLQNNHNQLLNHLQKIQNTQINLQSNVAQHKQEINFTKFQQSKINQQLKEINSLVEDINTKAQEQKYIKSIPNLKKFYNTFYSTLSHCYCQSVVIKSKNVILDSQNLLIQIGISLIALLPVVGYTISSSTQFIYQSLEDSELIKKSILFTKLANSQTEFDTIAEFISRKITLFQEKDLISENFKIDQNLFKTWIQGFDLILENLGVSKFKLPQIANIEYFAHLQVNYIATYYITNQLHIQEQYEDANTLKEKSELLVDIIKNYQNYKFDNQIKNPENSCQCDFCYIF